jgi:GTPase
MKFYDKAKLTVQSWKWGDWVVSARREAWVPYGGPAGGNGGKWWSIILRANPHLNTLVDFHNQKKLSAPNGDPWRTKEQYGKNAEDLIIGLPLGSIVRDAHTGKPIWHCYHADDSFIMCRGGQWWVGNMHFKNAVNQYPNFALLWEPGEIKEIEIELQLLADVALIGTPSVGKSSLINTVANVKAKVADYPFTTLIPNLGSVKHRDVSFNMVDVPGLIQWASSWKWLGNEFLRHIMKARVWAFMMDLSRYESWMHEFETLAHEIITYMGDTLKVSKDFGQIDDIVFDFIVENRGLQLVISAVRWWAKETIITKDVMFIYNKADAVNDDEVVQECIHYSFTGIQSFLKKTYSCDISEDFFMSRVHITSTYARTGIDELLNDLVENHEVWSMQEFLREDIIIEPVPVAPRPWSRESITIKETTAEDVPWLIEQWLVDEQDVEYSKVWYIKEREVARLTYMVPRWNDEAEMRYWNVLDKKKLLQKLVSAGLVKWDIIHVQSFYTWVEDRFIRY